MKISNSKMMGLSVVATVCALSGCGPREEAAGGEDGGGGNTSGASTSNSAGGANAGGANAGAKKTFLIGMSQANKGEPWRQAMNDQISTAAAKHPELKVAFADAAQNNSKQVSDVENFLTQGVDLLIISPNEAAPLTDVVAKVYDKGIPVILIDRKVNGPKFTMHIGADNVDIGKRAGKFAVAWCKANGRKAPKVLEIRGLEGTSGTRERGDGFRAGIAGSPLKIVAQQNADWVRERAITVSQSMFQANPSPDVVYGHNDPMAEAAVISGQGAGITPAKTLFIGVDGLPTPDGGLKSVEMGRLGATFVYPTGGAEAIDWAVKILEQKAKPPREVVLPTQEVTKANAMEIYKKYGGK